MRRVALCLLAGLTAAACSSDQQADMSNAVDSAVSMGQAAMDTMMPGTEGVVWNAMIQGQGSQMGLTGTAQVTVESGQTHATVNLTGATPAAVLPWHVHDGTCATGGGIVGDPNAYTPMTVAADGTAESTAEVTIALDTASQYHVNIHASPDDMGTIVGCGDLTR